MKTTLQFHMTLAALAALSLAGIFTDAAADPAVYVCRTNGIGSPTYMKLDDKAKTVSLGREAGKYDLVLPAIFNRDTVTWSRKDGTVNWNYTFDVAAGMLVYGWRTGQGDLQQDSCKKK